ncbi:MAG: hypothetical protein GY903_26425 [Fuerstiella sp.]|nr:hypothetical protein [Fuerstiella sp.]MCP4858034.1 hypothetical protein [Fuerstiella sp.]
MDSQSRSGSSPVVQVGDDAWNEIYRQIAGNLLEEQGDKGAWPLGSHKKKNFGRAYSTALGVLAFAPAYQLLPIHQR